MSCSNKRDALNRTVNGGTECICMGAAGSWQGHREGSNLQAKLCIVSYLRSPPMGAEKWLVSEPASSEVVIPNGVPGRARRKAVPTASGMPADKRRTGSARRQIETAAARNRWRVAAVAGGSGGGWQRWRVAAVCWLERAARGSPAANSYLCSLDRISFENRCTLSSRVARCCSLIGIGLFPRISSGT